MGTAEPVLTHSQGCTTKILVRGLRTAFPVRAAIDQLDAAVVRTMNTLPRGSELSMVYRAHATPQFIEDALREALWAVYTALDGAPFRSLRGTSTSAESIHDFDLSAAATLTAVAARRLAERLNRRSAWSDAGAHPCPR
jgi:GTP cyclohydrolase FolE2